jgi:hypothetical protein
MSEVKLVKLVKVVEEWNDGKTRRAALGKTDRSLCLQGM